MYLDRAVEFDMSKFKASEDIWNWTCEKTPWKYPTWPFGKGVFMFYNLVHKKFATIPIDKIYRGILYLPTNSPGTDEKFITMVLAVNGRYEVNYDESENRFDANLKDKSKNHLTRIDMFVNRQPDYKKDKAEKKGQENG